MPGATPYVLVEEKSVGGNQSAGRRKFQLFLTIFALLCSAMLFVDGILSLIATHSNPYYISEGVHYDIKTGIGFNRYTANLSIRVLSAYLMLFAILFIFIELKSTTILTPFAGMISPLGRGVVYFIVGLLVFGLVGNLGLFFGVLWMINGVLHIVFGARNCRNFYDEGTVDNGTAVVTKTVESNYDAGTKNFCRSCGAALRPTDAYCPDCSAAV